MSHPHRLRIGKSQYLLGTFNFLDESSLSADCSTHGRKFSRVICSASLIAMHYTPILSKLRPLVLCAYTWDTLLFLISYPETQSLTIKELWGGGS